MKANLAVLTGLNESHIMPWPSPWRRTRHPIASGRGSTGRPGRVVPSRRVVQGCQPCRLRPWGPQGRPRPDLRACHHCQVGQQVQVVQVGRPCRAVPSVRLVPCHRPGRPDPSSPSVPPFRPAQPVREDRQLPERPADQACPILQPRQGCQRGLVVRLVQEVRPVPWVPVGKVGTCRPCSLAPVEQCLAALGNRVRRQSHLRHQHRLRPVVPGDRVGRSSCRRTCTGHPPDAPHVGRARVQYAREPPPSRCRPTGS